MAIHADGATTGGEHAQHQLTQGRFATARLANDGDHIPCGNREIELVTGLKDSAIVQAKADIDRFDGNQGRMRCIHAGCTVRRWQAARLSPTGANTGTFWLQMASAIEQRG